MLKTNVACPFCGSTTAPTLFDYADFENKDLDPDFEYHGLPGYTICCDASTQARKNGCGASIGYCISEEEALTKWENSDTGTDELKDKQLAANDFTMETMASSILSLVRDKDELKQTIVQIQLADMEVRGHFAAFRAAAKEETSNWTYEDIEKNFNKRVDPNG